MNMPIETEPTLSGALDGAIVAAIMGFTWVAALKKVDAWSQGEAPDDHVR